MPLVALLIAYIQLSFQRAPRPDVRRQHHVIRCDCAVVGSFFVFSRELNIDMMRHRYERPAGLFITFYVYIVYVVALRFEGWVAFMPLCTLY
jgi:hypothetical protein